jgi:hypothetical protein
MEALDEFLTKAAIDLKIPSDSIPREITEWKSKLKYIYHLKGLREFCQTPEWESFPLDVLVKLKITKMFFPEPKGNG